MRNKPNPPAQASIRDSVHVTAPSKIEISSGVVTPRAGELFRPPGLGSETAMIIVLTTHDGGELLKATLDGYTRTIPPHCSWRMIVADNGSDRVTINVLRSYLDMLPLTIVSEPRAGKNRALNRAVATIGFGAKLVIFTDDDAIPNPEFLRAWEPAIYRGRFDLFGGWVEPDFMEPPAAWLMGMKQHFPELYAENLRTNGEIPADAIFGPNMAVRGALIAAGYRFDETIGPNSTNPLYPMGGETEFCLRLARRAGARAWFTPKPQVRHMVRPHQMTREFVANRAARHGRGQAMRDFLENPAIGLHIGGAVRLALHRMGALIGRDDSWWNYHWQSGYRSAIAEARKSFPLKADNSDLDPVQSLSKALCNMQPSNGSKQ